MKQSTKNKISKSLRYHHAHKRLLSKVRIIITAIQIFLVLFIGAHAVKLYAHLEDMNSVHYVDEYTPNLTYYEVMDGNEFAYLMAQKAEKYGVSYDVMQKVVECESKFDHDTQSFHYFEDGTRENSWGLSQIYLDVHTHVTREQAIDPDFALEFMAKKFSEGKHHLWSCYNILKKRGVV